MYVNENGRKRKASMERSRSTKTRKDKKNGEKHHTGSSGNSYSEDLLSQKQEAYKKTKEKKKQKRRGKGKETRKTQEEFEWVVKT